MSLASAAPNLRRGDWAESVGCGAKKSARLLFSPPSCFLITTPVLVQEADKEHRIVEYSGCTGQVPGSSEFGKEAFRSMVYEQNDRPRLDQAVGRQRPTMISKIDNKGIDKANRGLKRFKRARAGGQLAAGHYMKLHSVFMVVSLDPDLLEKVQFNCTFSLTGAPCSSHNSIQI